MLAFVRKDPGDPKTKFINGESPFKDLVTFKITGHGFYDAVDNGKVVSRHPLPALETTVGTLFLSMLTKRKLDKDGNVLTPSGTFNLAYQKVLVENPNADDSTIFEKVEALVKGKELIVHRKSYAALGKNGPFAANMVEIDFK